MIICVLISGQALKNNLVHILKNEVFSDPIFIDFGRLSTWNCPTDNENEVDHSAGQYGGGRTKQPKPTQAVYTDTDDTDRDGQIPNNAYSDTPSLANSDQVDDLDSEPSINLRRKFKGMFNIMSIFILKKQPAMVHITL